MQQRFLLFGLIFFITSCNNDKKSAIKTDRPQAIYIGVVTQRDSTKTIGEVLRVIQDAIKTDSASGVKTIKTDTVYAVFKQLPVLDSLKQVIKTSTGRDSTNSGWLVINKDSVSFKIDGIPVEQLVKKN